LHCLDLETGKRIWRRDVMKDFGAAKGYFGAAGSPLVEDGKVILNAGGNNGAGVVAFSGATGETLWKATDHPAGYSSAVAATIGGKRRVLAFTRTGLVDIDPQDGNVRFAFRWRSRSNASVNAAVPVVSGNLVFLSASYGTGAVLLRIEGDEPRKVWSSDDVMSNHYASAVLKDGRLYGYHGRQEFGPSLRCVDFASGELLWSEDGFRSGTVTLAGDDLLLVRENGEIVIAPAIPEGFRPRTRAKVLNGTVRAYPALADGLLYVRNEKRLVCVRVGRE
jgi:outer membrane protein assembly factor BamB